MWHLLFYGACFILLLVVEIYKFGFLPDFVYWLWLQSTKGRRPRTDDIDAPSRLSLLSNSYYRDALGDYGAFFAIANRIDRIHKNSWIGFQSWRATARKVYNDSLFSVYPVFLLWCLHANFRSWYWSLNLHFWSFRLIWPEHGQIWLYCKMWKRQGYSQPLGLSERMWQLHRSIDASYATIVTNVICLTSKWAKLIKFFSGILVPNFLWPLPLLWVVTISVLCNLCK
jgi:hypothetical protein